MTMTFNQYDDDYDNTELDLRDFPIDIGDVKGGFDEYLSKFNWNWQSVKLKLRGLREKAKSTKTISELKHFQSRLKTLEIGLTLLRNNMAVMRTSDSNYIQTIFEWESFQSRFNILRADSQRIKTILTTFSTEIEYAGVELDDYSNNFFEKFGIETYDVQSI